jgi:hypothetical protein
MTFHGGKNINNDDDDGGGGGDDDDDDVYSVLNAATVCTAASKEKSGTIISKIYFHRTTAASMGVSNNCNDTTREPHLSLPGAWWGGGEFDRGKPDTGDDGWHSLCNLPGDW